LTPVTFSFFTLLAKEDWMGRETQLQAFPEEWALVRQVQTGECSGNLLQASWNYLAWLRGKQYSTDAQAYFQVEDDPQRRAVFGTTLELLAVDPELLWRQANLDRRFEVLRYLLTESAPNDSARQLYEFAIDGSRLIHPEATATQGYPICWNDADTTKRIHAALGPIEFSSLAMHFGTEKYLAAALYKKSADRREVFALHAYFCELKEYYRAAARANCGTLVLVD
jgi:Domain of unknown function (DUF1877)